MTQPISVRQVSVLTRGFMLVVAAFGAAIVLFGQPTLDNSGAMRYQLAGSLDANDSAAILAMAAPIALAGTRRISGTLRQRLLSGLVLGVICLSVLRTGSRGGAIALVVGLVVVTLSNRGAKALIAIAVLAVSLLAVRQYAPPELIGRFAAIGSEQEDYNMTEYGGRWQIWKRGISYFAQDPVFGVGAGGFPIREGAQMREDGISGKWSAAHNAYIQSFGRTWLRRRAVVRRPDRQFDPGCRAHHAPAVANSPDGRTRSTPPRCPRSPPRRCSSATPTSGASSPWSACARWPRGLSSCARSGSHHAITRRDRRVVIGSSSPAIAEFRRHRVARGGPTARLGPTVLSRGRTAVRKRGARS